MTTLPDTELDLLCNSADLAARLAGHGCVFAGWQELAYGLERATAAWEDGEPWADELIILWERACTNYAAEWGEGLLE
jgi:hypothetical protein